MPYPDRYDRTTDFAREQQLGVGIRGVAINSELSRAASVLNQINTFVRRFATADGRLKLDSAVRIHDAITEELFDGDGILTVFTFASPIDSTVDLVRVFVGGVRTDPLSYNDTTFTMAVAPIVGVDNVQALVYTNPAGVLDRLLSVVQDEGADIIGYSDPESRYDSNTVGPALTEVMRDLDNLIIALGDLAGYVLTNGTRVLTGMWEINERSTVTIPPAAAVGSFRITGLPADGGLVTLSDGTNTIIFEFDTNSIVTPGNTPVAVGVTIEATAENFVVALNNAPLAIVASKTNGGAYFTVNLSNEIPYALGNVAITFTATNTGTYVGMTGGVDGSFSAAYKNYFRIRNSPRSIRDGDVVVHEQLLDLSTLLTSSLTSFLRTDGANQMNSDFNLGGNRVINAAAATQNGELVRFDEFQTINGSQITAGSIASARLVPFIGDTGTGGVQGAVPAPAAGDGALKKFLRADGVWAIPAALGGYILLQDLKATTVAGGTSVAGAWTKRTINTEAVDTGGDCSLVADQFTLAAGTYRIKVHSSFFRSSEVNIRLRNMTDVVTTLVGMPGFNASTGTFAVSPCFLEGRFTIAAPKAFELQYFLTAAFATTGLGVPANTGESEIYSSIELVKE